MLGTTDFHQRVTVKKAVYISTHHLLIKCRIFDKMTWTQTHTWTSSSFRMGMDGTLYFCLSSLERGEDIIFLWMWEGAMKCLFWFLLRSEVKGIELHFGSWNFSDGYRREGICGLPLAFWLTLLQQLGMLSILPEVEVSGCFSLFFKKKKGVRTIYCCQ